MALYITRTITITTKQVSTPMSTQGSVTAPGAITGYTGVSSIIAIISGLSAVVTSAAVMATVFVRISGGIIGGEQDVAIGAISGGFTTSGTYAIVSGPNYVPVSIQLSTGQGSGTLVLNCDTDTGGTFLNRLDVAVTLVLA